MSENKTHITGDHIQFLYNSFSELIKSDPEYAWSWHCNIAVPLMDRLSINHESANHTAAHLMECMFGVDTTSTKEFKSLEETWTKSCHDELLNKTKLQLSNSIKNLIEDTEKLSKESSNIKVHNTIFTNNMLSVLMDELKIDAKKSFVHLTCDMKDFLATPYTRKQLNLPTKPITLEEIFIELQESVGKVVYNKLLNDELKLHGKNLDTKPSLYEFLMSAELKDNNIFFMETKHWMEVIGDNNFANNFDPVSKHELLLMGRLGDFIVNGQQIKIYTDAYEHPLHKFLTNSYLVSYDTPYLGVASNFSYMDIDNSIYVDRPQFELNKNVSVTIF